MSMTPAPAEDLVVLGKIVSVHGVKGDVKVYSFTEPLTNVLNYPHWTLKRDGEVKQVEVASGRLQGKVLVAKLKGLDDREVARTFAGFDICVPRSQLPELSDGDYYWYQLEGLKVIDQAGQLLGKIDHLFETGANDVMVVRATPDSVDGEERMIPWHRDIVQLVDLQAGQMTVNWGADY